MNTTPPVLRIVILAASIIGLLSPLHAIAQPAHKVGLVLSGGGARGAAHIGVLKVLEREGIPIHCIAGTSFGGLVGGLYALGYSAPEIEDLFARQDWSRIFTDAPERRLSPLLERKNARYQGQLAFQGYSPELPTGLWGGQKLIEILNALTTERMIAAGNDFDRLPIPFRTIATDLVSGKRYVFRKGPMSEAIRASAAIPMLFTPVETGDMLLVDGGLVDNLPTDLAREMGADIIIAVDVSSPPLKKEQIRSFLDVIDQSLSLMMRQTVAENAQLANLIIRPNLEGFTYSDYTSVTAILKRGEDAAQDRVGDLKSLVAGIPGRTEEPLITPPRPVIEKVAFQGLKHVPARQLRGEVKTRAGEALNSEVLRNDLSRLYATRLFDRVDSSLEPLGQGRYRLDYIVKEAPLNTLGASIRYDSDYKFVALGEITARQLFNSYSRATISTQFGGLQNHWAAFRFVAPALPFLYIEPRVHLRRRERLEIQNDKLLDQYTDRRVGGQLVVGGTFLKRLELEVGYRTDRVTISGGTFPNALADPMQLAGLTFRLNRDTLDAQEYPHSGMAFRFQVDRRSTALGGDVSYWKWQGDVDRFLTITPRSTLQFRASAGRATGDIPFFDQFYIGGFNFSEGASRQLLGYRRDELLARQMGIAGVSFRREVFRRPLSFAKRGFLTGSYNLAAVSTESSSPYHFNRYHGIGAGLAIDTLFGPVRLTGGWGEQGRFDFYITLGPSF